MDKLLSFFDREIYLVNDSCCGPAVYYITDKEAGGILINAPVFESALLAELEALAEPRYLFLPSHLGAQDLSLWRDSGTEVIAYEAETELISGKVDIKLDRKTRLSRTIDFLPMAGRTPGSCALRLRNLPGVIFFGPILSPDESNWPTLIANDDDYQFETRIFGILGLQDLTYDYAFTDQFIMGKTNFGPNASEHINRAINAALESI